eukprot:SAG11_NODE_5563_length_1523_cov_1.122191_1_plen_43_part_10
MDSSSSATASRSAQPCIAPERLTVATSHRKNCIASAVTSVSLQ